jgi:hypothetical protein
MSGEHVWPDWLARYVIEEPEERAPWVKVGNRGVERIRDAPMFSHEVKRVCDRCNNVWLDRIDGAVRPVLRWMIIGRDCALDAETQAVLALWCTLRAYVAQFIHGETSVPPEHFRFVHREQQLPKSVAVWLAYYGGRRYPVFSAHKSLTIAGGPYKPAARNGYFATFSVGRFVAQVFGEYIRGYNFDLRRPPAHLGYVHRIWPRPARFGWPPPRRLTDGGLRDIAEFSL